MRRFARPLLYLGIVGIVYGLAAYHAWVLEDYGLLATARVPWTAGYAIGLIVAAYGVGLPEITRTPRESFVAGLTVAVVGASVVSVLQLFVGDALLPRFVVFGTAVLVVPWAMLCSAVASAFRSQARRRDRVVVVSTEADRSELERDLAANPEVPAVVVGWLTPLEATSAGGPSKPLVEAVVTGSASVVVLDRDAQAEESVVGQTAQLHEHGVRVRTLSLFYEQWLAKLPVSELERVSLMFDIGEVHRLRYSRVSRVVDLVAATLGLVVLVVVTPLVLLGDLLANRGPLLYRQERVGRHGRVFQILKFRTMRVPSAGDEAEWTGVDDHRITPFGGFMRRSHLDELPQVINILRGDLSVVGPRPEQPRYVGELTAKLPFYDLRHLVRPGLTGWAQVKYGYAGDERDALHKLQYEFWYLRHQGLMLDLRIIGRTVRSVLGSEGSGR